MIEREKGSGKITFLCDSCSEIEPTDLTNFGDALALVMREGWRSRQIAGEWRHGCPKCGVPK